MNPYPPDGHWTYLTLRQALTDREILLRVHTSLISPLPGDHNDPSTSGFTARNPAFQGLAPGEFRLATARLRMEAGWADGPYMRKVIIDHLNNSTKALRTPHSRSQPPFWTPSRTNVGLEQGMGRRLSLGRPQIPTTQRRVEADEQSPWISTTEKLDWALWYISKLLSQGCHTKVHLTVIRNGARHGEISIKPFPARITDQYPPRARGMDGIDEASYSRARSNAITCREVLLYGRIFGESIISDLTFTPYELPFGLPLQFWNPPDQTDPSRSGWSARLRFHPLLLNFRMAMDNVNKPPAPRLRGSWSMQPVNPNLQAHAWDQRLPTQTQIPSHIYQDHPSAIMTTAQAPDQAEPNCQSDHRPHEEEEEVEEEITHAIEGLLVDLTLPGHLGV